MIKSLGHAGTHRRVAINVGSGFVPGTNAVVMGAAIAGGKLGWEMIGICDGFEGLLHPQNYPKGGLIPLSPELIENLDPATGGILGQAPRVDPFHASSSAGGEIDLSDAILKRLKEEDIDALISIVGNQGLGILQKLHFKGLHTVCIPRSIENDIAATAVSFGFNSALSVTIEMLNKAHQAARSARKIAVVEVPGEHAGWIALQAGIAVRADAVLMPEIPCDLKNLAKRLKDKISARRPYGLVVVAEGAKFVDYPEDTENQSAAISIESIIAGQVAITVATRLQKMINEETYPLVIGAWARGGNPTATDHQLGMAYGAGSVQVLKGGQNGVMVSFMPPDIRFVPLADAVNKVRTVPTESEFMRIAQSLGIYLGQGL
jgi:ATP-dependent phosphofructokinase / diphosphate-dependent phosphofructokinase